MRIFPKTPENTQRMLPERLVRCRRWWATILRHDGHDPRPGCVGRPVRRGGAVGRRQEQHGQRIARAGARHSAVRLVYDAPAASRRIGRRPLSLRGRSDVSRAQGPRRISRARLCPWQLVRYIRRVAESAGGVRAGRAARDRLAGRCAGAPAYPRFGAHLHPAAVDRGAEGTAHQAGAGF